MIQERCVNQNMLDREVINGSRIWRSAHDDFAGGAACITIRLQRVQTRCMIGENDAVELRSVRKDHCRSNCQHRYPEIPGGCVG
jgi:hypothetical protein